MTRRDTGKTSILSMVLSYYLFFGVLGTPVYWLFWNTTPKEGQVIHTVDGSYTATKADEMWGHAQLIGGYLGGVSVVLWGGWAIMRPVAWLMFYGDPEYKAWRESGGDPYFDSMPAPFDGDDQDTRERY